MVEVRPPVDEPPPTNTIGGTSIEIGAGMLPPSDELAAPSTEVSTATVPAVAAARGGPSYLFWGISGTAIAVVGGIAALMLFGGSKSSPPQAAPVAQAITSDSASSELARAESNAADPSSGVAAETQTDQPQDVVTDASPDASTVVAASEVVEAEPAADLPSLPALPPVELAPAAPAVATSNDTQPVPATNQETPQPKPVMTFDPLDFDPAQFSFSVGKAAEADPGNASIPRNAEVAAGPPSDDEKNDTAKAAVPAPVVDRSLHAQLGPMPNGGASPQRTEVQLGTRLESISVADMELYHFVDTVSDVADVSVTVDPLELELAGVAPRQKVSIDVADITVEDALRQVFSQHRLELVEAASQLRAVLIGGEGWREVTYDVADLASAEDAAAVARLFQRFIAPDSWTQAGGHASIAVEKSKMRIEHSKRVHHEILIFCERLRVARGLPQRSRYPASLLSTVSPYEAAAPALQQQVTFTFMPWSPLGDMLRHWQEVSELTILVDWQALAELGLGPSSPVACSAIDRSWEDVLDGILEPIGLAWWAVNGETIQITSREALEGIRRVELHAVPKAMREQFATGDALVESLQGELAKLATKAGATQPSDMAFDEPSGRLIVVATPDSHRYLTQRLGRGAKQVVSRRP